MAEPAALDGFLNDGAGRLLSPAATQFNSQPERSGTRPLPLDGESQTGALLRMLAQTRLIGVSIIEAGRDGMLALKIQVLRQDLENFRGGLRMESGHEQD